MRVALLALATALAGCCGGAPSHKCNFTPLPAPPRDAGPETPLLCGTQACGDTLVCCLTKTPPFAMCVDPQNYVASGCENTEVACGSPSDCPFGLVCCNNGGLLTCKPDQLCPGDGNPTYRLCNGDSDCPRAQPTCTSVDSADEAGVVSISICL